MGGTWAKWSRTGNRGMRGDGHGKGSCTGNGDHPIVTDITVIRVACLAGHLCV